MQVVVVGGGVIGLSCAWHLARGGARVTVVERGTCGAGATLASLGALWPASALARGALQRWHRECLRDFPQFVTELERAANLPVPLEYDGRTEILTSADAAERAKREAAAASAEWSGWTPGDAAGTEPVQSYFDSQAAERSLGIAAPFGALRCEVTGQVHVPSLLRALMAACAAAGVHVGEQSPVSQIVVRDEKVRAVAARDEEVAADHCLLCAGAWTSALMPPLSDDIGVRPAKGQGIALALEPGTNLPRGILKRGPIYLVPWREQGEVLVGSTTEPEAGFADAPTAEARDVLLAGAAECWPELHNARILRHWAGLRPDGPKHRPVMRASDRIGGLWICSGHYKTGIGMAGATGAAMAGAILHGAALPTF